jgi:four helix bundle protein
MPRQLSDNGFFAFEDLEVYHLAVELAADVYKLLEVFPESEKFALTQQMKRSVTSIALNIAEGRGRGTDKDFARFLLQSRGSLLETVSGFHLAERLGFINKEHTRTIYKHAHHLAAKLTAFIQTLHKE